MADEPRIAVEVAYALPHKQKIVGLQVPEGTTAREAVQQSGIGRDFPDLDVAAAPLGLFGKAIKEAQVLAAGDRVEIYRPLKADPKDARKARAAKAKSAKAGDNG